MQIHERELQMITQISGALIELIVARNHRLVTSLPQLRYLG